MLELFVFETLEMVAQLESIILESEEGNAIESKINDVFRIVHTVKGSAAMMSFNNIATLSHALEDVFYYLREGNAQNVDYSALADISLRSTDFIKNEVTEIQGGTNPESDASGIVQEIKGLLASLKGESVQAKPAKGKKSAKPAQEVTVKTETTGKNRLKAVVIFENGCEMENIRSFGVLHNLETAADIISYSPSDITENPESTEIIREKGFEIQFATDLDIEDIKTLMSDTLFLRELRIEPIENPAERKKAGDAAADKNAAADTAHAAVKQSLISVNISKLDRLMDLVGELVTSQAMVLQNPELQGLELSNFDKASRQLQKVTNDLQDAVMSVRMVSLSATFQKMHRTVRDMSRKLDKDIKLEIIGENTEVDKNIVEHLSDPLLHMIRNAMDHGIESAEERIKKGKPAAGKITLEAKNESGEVWIIVRDDGRGLDKVTIRDKARRQGLLKKTDEELTDKEIYSCIFHPGFSTNESITEFSGRGVGMDVVRKNIDEIGGAVLVDSKPDAGTTISIKIPLTLAIIDGMTVRVGDSIYIIPITSIKESFKASETDIVRDETSESEMILLRGECYSILRLHEVLGVRPDYTNLDEGIIVAVESDSKILCLFTDELIGQQQVVVKALPAYIKKADSISGCTIMGDGNVSLILNVSALFGRV